MIVNNKQVSIWVEHFGQPEQPALLLIAGAMAPAAFWPNEFCESLAKRGLCVIRFDNRDVGRSTHFEPCRPDSGKSCPYTMGDLVGDCLSILDAYRIEKCHIAGHSPGGSIAQLFTVKAPERLLSAIAISSPILATGCPGIREPAPEVQAQTWEVLMGNPMHDDAKRGIPEFLKVWKYLNGSLPFDEAMARSYTEEIL